MLAHKRIRERGKTALSRLFKEFKEGDRVSLSSIPGEKAGFPERYHGRTGEISEKRGRAYAVNVKDGGKIKQFLVKGIHLKKLSS
jgi:large subunit ribosomal protein L21e